MIEESRELENPQEYLALTNEEKESGRMLFYFHNVKGDAIISTLINYYCFCSLMPDRLRQAQMRRMSWDNS